MEGQARRPRAGAAGERRRRRLERGAARSGKQRTRRSRSRPSRDREEWEGRTRRRRRPDLRRGTWRLAHSSASSRLGRRAFSDLILIFSHVREPRVSCAWCISIPRASPSLERDLASQGLQLSLERLGILLGHVLLQDLRDRLDKLLGLRRAERDEEGSRRNRRGSRRGRGARGRSVAWFPSEMGWRMA